MKNSYKKRPEDFKRRILKKVTTTRKDLLLEEEIWIHQIKDEELGKRYYNLCKRKIGHWSTNVDSYKSSVERMKINQKIAYDKMTPEEKSQKFGYWKNKCKSESSKEALRNTMRSLSAEERSKKFGSTKGIKLSEERRLAIIKRLTGRIVSEETRNKLSKSLMGNQNCLGNKLSEETKRTIGEKNRVNTNRYFEEHPEARERQRQAQMARTLSAETRKKISDKNKGINRNTSSQLEILRKRNLENNPSRGKKWYTNDVLKNCKLFFPGEEPPEFVQGRTFYNK